MIRQGLIAATALAGLTGLAAAETPEGAAERVAAVLDQMPQIGPGFAVVVVTEDEVVLNRVTGDRRASTGAPMTADTPMYIASQTKAYMGLLAAVLDEQGVLSLDARIGEIWPDLDIASGVDISQWTMRDLLSHQVPVDIGIITTLEAYVTRVAPEDYPRLVEAFAEAREPGFEYDNLGYNLYGALLETVTGKTWQDWLDEVIFEPAGMEQTSARTSDFTLDELAWNHIWQGDEQGWFDVRPKTDGMMQSAGGLVTSPNDMATWLQLQLRDDGLPGSDITASAVATSHTGFAETGMEDGRNPYEMSCSHYTLGWNVCDYEGNAVYVHGGGYTGARSMMAFSPDLGVGVAAFSNSDNQTGWVASRATLNMFLMFLVEHEDATRMAELRVNHYPERIARVLEIRTEREAGTRAEERWGGWDWQPDADELADYAGRWTTGEPYLDLDIRLVDDELVMRWGDMNASLQPATRDVFAAQSAPFQSIEGFEFSRDDQGRLTGMTWDDSEYRRVD